MGGWELGPGFDQAMAEAEKEQKARIDRENAMKAPAPRPGKEYDDGHIHIADVEQVPAAIRDRLEGFAHGVGDAQGQQGALRSAADGGGFGEGISQDGDALKKLLTGFADDAKPTLDGLGETSGVLWQSTLDGFKSVNGQDEENVAGILNKMDGWER